MKLRKRIAFTIIEVLTVLAILGTLTAIGVNEYTTSINTTRTITFRENVDAIVDCLNVHFSINHRYPDSLEEIRGCLNKTPINPFTGEDMLTDGSITYTPLNDGLEYIIVVHQPDVDDHDGDGDTDEPIIEPPTMLSENIHIIIHPSGAGTAQARPNPADSGVVVFLTSKAGQCYNFNSWQPISDITINNPLSPDTTFTMIGDEVSIMSKFDIKRYQVTLTSPGGEEVLGAGEYNCGEQVTVQAIPLTGHYFVGWYSGNTLVSVSPYYTFRIYNDVTLEARSAYYITLYANPEIGGSPTVSPNPAAYGDVVRLTSNPSTCYDFTSWTADVPINNNQFTMPPRNVIITANYTIKQYTIAITITKTGNSPNTPGTVTGAGTYNCGSTATLTAVPATGFTFTGWYESGSQVSTNTTYSFTVSNSRTLEARFAAVNYNISFVVNPTGAGSPSASPNPANVGQTVTLTTSPGSCYNFSSWSSSDVTISSNTFTMPAKNVAITANYSIKTYTINASAGSGGTISPSGSVPVNCGGSQTFSIVPNTGYTISSVTVDGTNVGAVSSYTFTNVTSNRTISASFSAIQYSISLSSSPSGAGSPSASPNPATYGQTVTLTANPGSCYTFGSWSSSDVSITGNTFTMPAKNVSITANYSIKTYTVSLSASGGGTVSGGGTYNCGSTATIRAIPNTGYYFVRWSDGNTSSQRNITVNSNISLTAEFAANSYTLSLSVASGCGNVSGGGTYAYGTQVYISASPCSGYYFDRWSDGNTSSGRYITITGNTSLSAYFYQSVTYYTISTSVVPGGSGYTTGQGSYAAGTSVTLRGYCYSGYEVVGWDYPGCSSGSSCNVTVWSNIDTSFYCTPSAPTPIGTFSGACKSSPSAGGICTVCINGTCKSGTNPSVSISCYSGDYGEFSVSNSPNCGYTFNYYSNTPVGYQACPFSFGTVTVYFKSGGLPCN